MNKPDNIIRVSVCIATYNGGQYIEAQLRSILGQLAAEDEVIVADDSSTDNTLEVIQGICDPRIRVYAGNAFRSPIYNFEFAIGKAAGQYIFLSDQDDLWAPGKVAFCLAQLQQYDLVTSNCSIIDKEGQLVKEQLTGDLGSARGVLKNIYKNKYMGACMAFKRTLLQVALPFPKDIPMHDAWIGLVAGLFYKVTFVQAPLVLYRRHDNNKSTTSEASSSGLVQMIRYRWNLVKYLPLLVSRKFKNRNR